MLTRILGNKVGMTQVFDENKNVVPVTVINVSDWLVTQVKSKDRDGYSALQLGQLKKKYVGQEFSQEWISKKKNYFTTLREVHLNDPADEAKFTVGQKLDLSESLALEQGDFVNVSGVSKGLGFQGVMKRWDFAGGPGGHGSTFHKAPGSVGFMRRQGEVIKGKKLPGHCGAEKITVKGLQVVRLDKDKGHLLVRGAVPGKKNSLIYISKQG